jgi:hypothetical protein
MLPPRPFYYLENFASALAWLERRYSDLFDDAERTFISCFRALPKPSAGLLVRMVGRKGEVFPAARLRYPEIGCPVSAASALLERGWVECEPDPQLDWCPEVPAVTYRLLIKPLCERLRLLYFGDFDQDWSQFVLADLGIFKYEKVALDTQARAFQSRTDVDVLCALFECRKRLEEGADLDSVMQALPGGIIHNEWLLQRCGRLQFRIGQRCERQGNFELALRVYRDCQDPSARLRRVRVLERLNRTAEALQAAAIIREAPADEVEVQQITRMWARLQRKSGTVGPHRRNKNPDEWPTFQLILPGDERPLHLERATGRALSETDGPVFYVENGLMSSLFGLLCWDAIFAPVCGAFFHEFQAGPADLHAPGFHARRGALFASCFAQLDGDAYRSTIRHNFLVKAGTRSPFVFWGMLSQELLSLALDCVPKEHLKACFLRILAKIRANTTGLPDLVQFWPRQRRYRLIEVKGPGDRLQDNQIRWLRFCAAHDIPASVCQVSWGARAGRSRAPGVTDTSGGLAASEATGPLSSTASLLL